MNTEQAAAALGVAAYTVRGVEPDGDTWAITVRDMSNHVDTVRRLPRVPDAGPVAPAEPVAQTDAAVTAEPKPATPRKPRAKK